MNFELPVTISLDLLESLIIDEDCRFDHSGGCQGHGYLSLEPGDLCPMAEAKAVLKKSTDRWRHNANVALRLHVANEQGMCAHCLRKNRQEAWPCYFATHATEILGEYRDEWKHLR